MHLLLALALAAHPSLFYEASEVPHLQAEASTSRAEIARALIAGSGYASTSYSDPSVWDGDRPSAIATFAIDCMVMADPAVCQGAHDWVMAAVNDLDPSGLWDDPSDPDFRQAGFIQALAIAYDVLGDSRLPVHLSSSELAAVRTRLVQGASWFYGDLVNSPPWYVSEYLQNHNWNDIGALGVAAVALYGEEPAASDWLDYAVQNFQKLGQVLDLIPDGTWHEGFAYQGSSMSAWLAFPLALSHAEATGRITGEPDLTDNANVRAFAHYRALGSLPGKTYEHVLLHGDFFGFSHGEMLYALHWAAARFHDGEAQWLAEQAAHDRPRDTYGFEQEATALEYLVYDPSVAATPPAALDDYLSDLSGYISRSGYGPDDVVLGLKSGAFGGLANWSRVEQGGAPGGAIDFGHDHDDDLGFWLYGEGEWLASEAAGYVTHPQQTQGCPRATDSVFHNTLTFDGVGQIGDGDDQPEDTGDARIDWSRGGSVTAHAATAHYAFVEMDGTHLYPSSLGLSQVTRQVLFVDRRSVAVRDHMLASAPHALQWHAHALDGAMQDSSDPTWIQGIGKSDVALAMKVVTPSAFDAAFEDQYPCINTNEVYDPDRTVAHITLQSAQAATEQRFLVVMSPTTVSGWAARTDVQPLGDTTQARGFTLGDGQAAFVLGDAADTPESGATLSLVGKAGGEQSVGTQTRYLLAYGTSLSVGADAVLTADASSGAVEVDLDGQTIAVSGEGVTHVRALAPEAASATWNGQPSTLSRDPDDPRFVLVPGEATSGGSSSGSTGSGSTGSSSTTGGASGGGGTSGAHPPDGPAQPATGGCNATGGFDVAALLALFFLFGSRRRDGLRPSEEKAPW